MRDMHRDMARLRGLDRPYAQQALRRLALLAEWARERAIAAELGLTVREADDAFLRRLADRGDAVSRASLFGWRRAYRNDGWRGLIDQRTRHDKPAPAQAFLDEVLRLYRQPGGSRGKRRSVELCHDLASDTAARRGWRTCTLRESERFIRRQTRSTTKGAEGASGAG